jgi:hypothetical protein
MQHQGLVWQIRVEGVEIVEMKVAVLVVPVSEVERVKNVYKVMGLHDDLEDRVAQFVHRRPRGARWSAVTADPDADDAVRHRHPPLAQTDLATDPPQSPGPAPGPAPEPAPDPAPILPLVETAVESGDADARSHTLCDDQPLTEHESPEGVDDLTVEAVGLLSEALERTERARGHLYAFHQLTGGADFKVGDAVDALRQAGHEEMAERIATELVGRNVIRDRWTFQIVEDYDDNYWSPFREIEREARERLTAGRRHRHEAELKESRRTHGHRDHTAHPPADDPGVPATHNVVTPSGPR